MEEGSEDDNIYKMWKWTDELQNEEEEKKSLFLSFFITDFF